MTTLGLLGACARRWVVVVIGLVLTATFGWFGAHPQPVFWSRADAIFLAPLSSKNPNALAITSDSIVSTAGIVERIIDNGDPGLKTASSVVNLYDQGIYNGQLIRLPDSGGQWTHNFETAVLNIQVTGHDPTAVRNRMLAIEKRISSELEEIQRVSGAARQDWIQVNMPSEPSVVPVGGSTTRALVVSVLIGVGLTLTAVALVDRRRLRLAAGLA